MNFTDYMLYKAIALIAIVFIVNLVFSAITGRSIEQVRRDRESAVSEEKKEH